MDLEKAEKSGIKPGDARRAAAIIVSGLQVGSLFEDQRVFDVIVWSTPDKRRSLEDVQNVMIDTPNGGRVRLLDVAEVKIANTPTVIRRESISPYLDVSFSAQGRDLGAVRSEEHTSELQSR